MEGRNRPDGELLKNLAVCAKNSPSMLFNVSAQGNAVTNVAHDPEERGICQILLLVLPLWRCSQLKS